MTPDARQIVKTLKGHWSGRSGMCRCPAHGDRKPSLSVSETRDGRVLVHCFTGCDQMQVIGALRHLGLWPEGAVARDPSYPMSVTTLPDGFNKDERAKHEPAREIWQKAKSITGTVAERYLRARAITLPLPPSLRFAELRHPTDKMMKPALVGAVQGVDGRVTAIQRNFLRPDGLGKTDVDPKKLSLGPMKDGAVRLAKPGRILGLAEGIETALSAQQLFAVPVWATLGVGRMPRVHIPEDVETVWIFADAGDAGVKGAIKAAEDFEDRGYGTEIQAPEDGDWNDYLKSQAA